MAYAVGIDLGTTNSVISVYRRGITETLTVEGRSTLPSVISFRPDGSLLVGQAAKSRMLLDPESTAASAKRFMGDRNKVYSIGGKQLSPVDIASLVLKRMVDGASEALGQTIHDVVITVPAYFTETQREDTRKAGEKAGLNVLRLVPEPTAAAVAYGLDKGKDQTIMVYDLGGGTFDVSILEIRGNTFKVKSVGGNSQLGGDDFDQAIMSWAMGQFKKKTGVDLLLTKGREAVMARQRLKEASETAKIELSLSERAMILVPECMGHQLEMEITLDKYNSIIDPLLNKTVELMKSVLKDARLKATDIDRVILVGGSTKNRKVREIVAREIKEPYIADRVDEVVAHGASIIAANLFLPEEDCLPIEITNVTGHSMGIDMLDDSDRLKFNAIIPRQTIYPCRRGILGFTSRSRQDEVQMSVFRGEDPDPEKDIYLGQLSLPVSPPQDEQVPIGAIFELDDDGIIHFTGIQLPGLKSREFKPILDYAKKNDGALDLTAVDMLITKGKAKTGSVDIQPDDSAHVSS